MKLDEEALKEFQNLYFQQYGKKLTNQETLELGTRFINFVKAVFGSNLPKLKTVDTNIKKVDN